MTGDKPSSDTVKFLPVNTSMTSLLKTFAYFSFVTLILVEFGRRIRRKCKRYPPGPTGYPILGNIFDVPVVGPWNYFEALSKHYGPIVRLTLAGDEMMILSDPEDCEELLSRRSTNYSSRKPLVYAGKYQSHNKRLLLLGYGEELKKQRAAFAEMLNSRAVGSYEVLHERESSKLLFDMLHKPNEYKLNLKRFTASLVFTLTYGKKLNDDQNLHAVLKILVDFLPDCAPGAHLVDSFPILDRLPDILAPWRKKAQEKHAYEKALYSKLVNDVKADMDAGAADACLTVNLWEQHAKGKFDEETLAYLAGSAFEASIGTTSGTLLWFIVAMILYPETQKQAQAEIDSFLGDTGDMPSLSHMKNLPYCVALSKEVMRWMPVAPGAFPHYSDADDEYKGFHIPKHTLIVPHVWAIHRDPSLYPDPLAFEPRRFMGKGNDDSPDALTGGHFGFGFGRRICPARYLATKSIFIAITRILWAFRIEAALDANGRPIPVNPYNATFNITSEPHDFPLRLNPRSPKHAEKIREDWYSVANAWAQ